MHNPFAAIAREVRGRSAPSAQTSSAQTSLAGADEVALQELGVTAEALSFIGADLSTLCPDLVHEAQFGIGRRD